MAGKHKETAGITLAVSLCQCVEMREESEGRRAISRRSATAPFPFRVYDGIAPYGSA